MTVKEWLVKHDRLNDEWFQYAKPDDPLSVLWENLDTPLGLLWIMQTTPFDLSEHIARRLKERDGVLVLACDVLFHIAERRPGHNVARIVSVSFPHAREDPFLVLDLVTSNCALQIGMLDDEDTTEAGYSKTEMSWQADYIRSMVEPRWDA